MSESDQDKNLSPDDERKIEKARQLAKGTKNTFPNSVKKVEFLGIEKQKSVIQKELDDLDTGDRMWSITQNRKMELWRNLKDLRENASYADGIALYKEHREMLHGEFSEHEDHDEAYWIKESYLQHLYHEKVESKFWEDMKDIIDQDNK